MKGAVCELRKQLKDVSEEKHALRKGLVEMIDAINGTFAENYRPSIKIESPIKENKRLDDTWVTKVPQLWETLQAERDKLKSDIATLQAEKNQLMAVGRDVSEAEKQRAQLFEKVVNGTTLDFGSS